MVFPSRGRATAGTEQQGTRSCPGSESRRIHSKTQLQETKRESITSIIHIWVLLRTWMPRPVKFLQIYSKSIQIELSLLHIVLLQWGWNITRVYHLSLLFLPLLHNWMFGRQCLVYLRQNKRRQQELTRMWCFREWEERKAGEGKKGKGAIATSLF